MITKHPKLFGILLILCALVFFIAGVTLFIKQHSYLAIFSWLVVMILIILAINCMWTFRK